MAADTKHLAQIGNSISAEDITDKDIIKSFIGKAIGFFFMFPISMLLTVSYLYGYFDCVNEAKYS